MASFCRKDYEELFEFAREIYYWHEATSANHQFDLKAAHLMRKLEEVLGQMSSFPHEARARLKEDRRRNHPFKQEKTS